MKNFVQKRPPRSPSQSSAATPTSLTPPGQASILSVGGYRPPLLSYFPTCFFVLCRRECQTREIKHRSRVRVLSMANPFRSSPAPVTPRVMRAALLYSPLGERGHPSSSPRSMPSTPTPSQPPSSDFMRRPITRVDYQARSDLRRDRIFDEFWALMREAKTLVTFEWKPSKCQGKLVPAP
jgi:hypothetical protein